MTFINAPKSLFTLGLSLALMLGCSKSPESHDMANESAGVMDSLVTAEWLQAHLDDPDLVVLDCSVTIEADGNGGFSIVNGRPAFEKGHIPTAGFADLKGELADPESPHEYAVPTPEAFAAAMAALGVGDDTRVVLYDTTGGPWASRVWWMLRWIGFDNAALLDGGFNAWTEAGYPLSTAPSTEPVRTLSVNLRPELIVGKDEVLAAIQDADVKLIDAMPAAHYRGDYTMYHRAGHIPTASSVPSPALMSESGRFKTETELRSMFDGDTDQRTITYCGGGIAASTDAFIMTRLGYKNVAVYTASLQEWTLDPDAPMVTGADPGRVTE